MRRGLSVLLAPPLVALLLVALLLGALAACGERGGPPEAAPTGAGWQRLDDLPLSRRTGPVVVWTGTEVLAIGGETGTTCPPNADCAEPNAAAKDGAALDPETGHWRTIADAPLPVPAYTRGAVVTGHLFVKVGNALLDYDIAGDVWRRLPRAVHTWSDPVADGDRLVLVSGSDEQGVRPDLVYDVTRERWSRLPEDPIGPAFDRGVVATARGLVLLAHELVDNPGGGEHPSFVLAALLDRTTGHWRRLPDADITGSGTVSLVGDRLVLPSLDASNGGGDGDGDYGRMVRSGGRLDLGTETWSPLPHSPEYLSGGWPVDAPGSPVLAAEGWLYDDATGAWTSVPRPPGAPVLPGPAVWAGDRLVVVTATARGDDYERIRDLRVWVRSSPRG